jgi:hypothetical protein
MQWGVAGGGVDRGAGKVRRLGCEGVGEGGREGGSDLQAVNIACISDKAAAAAAAAVASGQHHQ